MYHNCNIVICDVFSVVGLIDMSIKG